MKTKTFPLGMALVLTGVSALFAWTAAHAPMEVPPGIPKIVVVEAGPYTPIDPSHTLDYYAVPGKPGTARVWSGNVGPANEKTVEKMAYDFACKYSLAMKNYWPVMNRDTGQWGVTVVYDTNPAGG